ncbi:hypothetical protein DXG03_009215 [Asterophora parasitica]|uniref:Uncharacterized protein n=1 Tax=Asterophora parasitica TaxID=117018 RepID=A0A9P7FZV0_9AGAR|nr:hypothetical protein DXG03_009215 [Asterophora parasitica]
MSSLFITSKPSESPPNALYTLSSVICDLHALRTLSVNDISANAYLHLAALPSLKCLALWSVQHGLPASLTLPANGASFLALEKFEFSSTALTHCTRLLLVAGKHLHSLGISYHESGTPSDWRSLTTTVEKSCSGVNLTSITIHTDIRYQAGPLDFPIQFQHIQPLLKFHNLTYSKLETPLGFDLDDTDVEEMAKAWPHLNKLHLKGSIHEDFHPRMTLASLKSLAQHCRHLAKVYIRIDATQPYVPATPMAPIIPHRSLTTLDVGRSPIEDPTMVATFLSDLFPCLGPGDIMHGYWRDELNNALAWSEVRSTLVAVRANKAAALAEAM